MGERYNTSLNRLEYLKELKGAAAMGKKKMSSKQHKEYLSLLAAHSGFSDGWDLQKTLKMISHIEMLHSTESATSADLIRLQVLKEKILDYDE